MIESWLYTIFDLIVSEFLTIPSHFILNIITRLLIFSDHLVKIKARLEPGKMFLVDFEKGEIVSDNIIKEQIASSRDYQKWLGESLVMLEFIVCFR